MTAKPNDMNGASKGAIANFDAFLSLPGFAFGQKFALESARFTARRMRAYADQWEALIGCTDPQALMSAQRNFIKQMQQDYAAESEVVKDIIAETTPAQMR